MKIGIIGSMQFTEKMIETANKLNDLGHETFMTSFAESFVGKTDQEKQELKLQQKDNYDVIDEFWQKMQHGEAVLVMNFDKLGIQNYIGGNTLMEIGFAHVLKQKIFLWNPIPEMAYCKEEIESVNPIIVNGDLAKVT
jgi:hypothetical protein